MQMPSATSLVIQPEPVLKASKKSIAQKSAVPCVVLMGKSDMQTDIATTMLTTFEPPCS